MNLERAILGATGGVGASKATISLTSRKGYESLFWTDFHNAILK